MSANNGQRMTRLDGTETTNSEIMAEALVAYQKGLPVTVAAAKIGVHGSRIGEAYAIIRDAPDLIAEVIAGDMSLYKARQIAVKGEKIPCPVCEGKGHVFRKRR